MTRAEALAFRAKLDGIIDELPDETALENIELYQAWRSGTDYAAGDRRQYGGKLYRCEQSHRSQEDWTPDATPALWTEISLEEWPEWRQPSGAQDAYRIGAKTRHNSKHWINEIDYNTYEPGVYGWSEVTD